MRRVCGVTANDPEREDYVRMMEESCDWMMEALRQPGAFDFGNETHFQRGLDWIQGVVRNRLNRAHPMYVYWNRSIFGFKAVLYRLRAQVDVNEVLRQERPKGWTDGDAPEAGT